MSRNLKRAVEWIAENDDRDELNVGRVAASQTVRLVEFMTNANPVTVAKMIVSRRLDRDAKEELGKVGVAPDNDDEKKEGAPA